MYLCMYVFSLSFSILLHPLTRRSEKWECKADMPGEYRFGQVTVACEGYSYPDDAYILKGSCGVSGLGERKKDRQK